MSAVLPTDFVAACGCAARVEVDATGQHVVTINPCRNGDPTWNAECPNFSSTFDQAFAMDKFIVDNGLR